MDEHSKRLTPEALLAHAGWLRELAAGLVADPGAADDVVQDTWVAALRHPPAVDRPLEPWLARVARNFAFRRKRMELRRAAHEHDAEPEREAPTPAQTVERLELQRTVVEAVLALDEPLRTTIVERYFEDRSAAEIARAFGVPAGTVRWRVSRGLEELRARLDGRFGSRAAWCAVLTPLARRGAVSAPRSSPPSASTALSTVMTMSATQAVAVMAGAVVVAGVVWWGFRAREPSQASAPSVSREVVTEPVALASTPVVGALEPPSLDARQTATPEAARAPASPAAAPVSAPRTAVVVVRFLDAAGAPWSGVRLAALHEDRPDIEWGAPVSSQADGRARLELVFPEWTGRSRSVSSQTLAFVASRAGCTTLVRRALVRVGEATHLGDIVLSAGVRLSGRVLDEAGRGLANATLGATGTELPPEEDGRLRRHGCDAFDLPVTRSAYDGTFVLDGVGAGTWRLWGHASGTRYAWTEPLAVSAEHDLEGVELVLPALRATDRIEGRIVDPDGKPLRAGLFCYVHDARYGGFGGGQDVDEQGRFSIVVQHDGEIWDLSATDFTGRFAETAVKGVVPGTLDLLIRMQAPRVLEVQVRDAEGRPVEGAEFLVSTGGAWSQLSAAAAAPGDYRLPLPDARFRMEVSARGYRTEHYRRPLEPAALSSPFDVVLRRAAAVRGRVLAAGAPVAHAEVELRRDEPDGLETVNGFRCVMSALADVEGSSDADGRFELFCDLDGPFWIRTSAPGLAPAERGPIDPASLATSGDFELVLTQGGAIEGRVLPPEGGVAEGTIVAINHGDGAPRTTRAGPGGVFRFEGLAPGKWQVLATDVDVDPSRTSYASLDEADPIEWSCEVAVGRTTRCDLELRPR